MVGHLFFAALMSAKEQCPSYKGDFTISFTFACCQNVLKHWLRSLQELIPPLQSTLG